jgi:transposase InsO family protein
VQTIQTDNGVEFQSAFHYHALDKGVGHVYIRPRTPRLNGKVERSHRIDAEEFYRLLDGTLIDDAKIFNDKLRQPCGRAVRYVADPAPPTTSMLRTGPETRLDRRRADCLKVRQAQSGCLRWESWTAVVRWRVERRSGLSWLRWG